VSTLPASAGAVAPAPADPPKRDVYEALQLAVWLDDGGPDRTDPDADAD
jgi:hypothetical protein